MRKSQVTFKVDEKLLKRFKEVCTKKGYLSIGECLREFMRRFIEANSRGLSWDLREPLKLENYREASEGELKGGE